MSTDNVTPMTRPARPFPINAEAQAAWQRVEDAYQRVDDVFGDVPWCSVGAPGSAVTLQAAAALIEKAVDLLRTIQTSREEDLRYRYWQRLHDGD